MIVLILIVAAWESAAYGMEPIDNLLSESAEKRARQAREIIFHPNLSTGTKKALMKTILDMGDVPSFLGYSSGAHHHIIKLPRQKSMQLIVKDGLIVSYRKSE